MNRQLVALRAAEAAADNIRDDDASDAAGFAAAEAERDWQRSGLLEHL